MYQKILSKIFLYIIFFNFSIFVCKTDVTVLYCDRCCVTYCILCWQMLCLIYNDLADVIANVWNSGNFPQSHCGRCCKPLWQMEELKEHLKPPSPIYDHSNISGHSVTINNFKIIGREDLNQIRTIKEALYIRVNDPSLNRNVGKYHIPHVWDEVLVNTSELKLK